MPGRIYINTNTSSLVLQCKIYVLTKLRILLDSAMADEIMCEFCAEVVQRSNYIRQRRRRHPDQSTSLVCRGVVATDVNVPPSVPVVSDVTTLMSTPVMTYHSEVVARTAPHPAPRISSAANQLVEAVQSLLEQCHLSSVEDLCDHVRQNFTAVPEHELFPLVVGAVAGAQVAAAHHFVVERDRAFYSPNMVHVAIRSGANLAMWNLGLGRFTQTSSGPSTVPGPRFQSEALPHSSSHIHYDRDGDAPF